MKLFALVLLLVASGRSVDGAVTDTELRAITAKLFDSDVNNVFDQLSLDYQGKTSSSASNDVAPGSFFSSVPSSALGGPTVAPFTKLLDTYGSSGSSSRATRKTDFLNAVMNTEVMKKTVSFLKEKKFVNNLRQKLDEIWFTTYSRGSGTSSGFEHCFVGEHSGGKVSGFHNWISFYREEKKGKLNYKGYLNMVTLNGNTGNQRKAEILLARFTWEGDKKPAGSVFVGTSPELEMAVYTICFFARPDKKCPVKMGDKQFIIQTWTYKYAGKVLVGSAYPSISAN